MRGGKRVYEREAREPHPQPLAGPGEKLPERGQDEDEAFSRWLAHVEAGQIG